MSFKREIQPRLIKSGNELDNDLKAIGFNVSCQKVSSDPNIEDTLISASIECVCNKNARIGGLLVDWITIHYERINVDRLTKVVTSLCPKEHKYVIAFWCANAQRLSKDPRFKRLAKFYSGKQLDYIDRFAKKEDYKSTEFQIERNGEDQRFTATCLRVPKKIFQHRPNQIFSAQEIAKSHLGFRFRVILGPTYRADMWAQLRKNPTATPSVIAKISYGSYPTAHQAKKDYAVIKRDYSLRNIR